MLATLRRNHTLLKEDCATGSDTSALSNQKSKDQSRTRHMQQIEKLKRQIKLKKEVVLRIEKENEEYMSMFK